MAMFLAFALLCASTVNAQIRFNDYPHEIIPGDTYNLTYLPVNEFAQFGLYDGSNENANLVSDIISCVQDGRFEWQVNENIPSGTYYISIGECTGQRFIAFSDAVTIPSANAGSPTTQSPGAGTGSAGSNSNSNNGQGNNGGGGGLSDAAKVGLGVGIGLGVPLLAAAALLGFWCGRRGRNKSGVAATGRPETTSINEGQPPQAPYHAKQSAPIPQTSATPSASPPPQPQGAPPPATSSVSTQATPVPSYSQTTYQPPVNNAQQFPAQHQQYPNELYGGYTGHTELPTNR